MQCRAIPSRFMSAEHHGGKGGVIGEADVSARENRNAVAARTALTPCGSETSWRVDREGRPGLT